MTSDKQIKINENLHLQVKEYVDNEESDYSSYKSFYEEATRKHLQKQKSSNGLTKEQREAVENIIEKNLE